MKRLKKYILLTGSIFFLLLPKKIVNACSFYVAPGVYRFWLLQPDLTNQPDLTPFFFASTHLYRQDPYAFPDPSIQRNIQEWHQFIHKAAAAADIDSLLNQTDPQYFFEHVKEIARSNSFLRFLLRPENKDLYNYLVLSKKVEQIAANPDPWEENRFPVAAVNKVIEDAKSLQQRSRLPFIELRLAFQLIRLYSYNHQPALLHYEYDKYIAQVPSGSWIKTAALFQKAIHTNSTAYNYLLSKVFDRGGYNRVSCLMKFQNNKTYEAMQHARNAHERTVLYTMQVLNEPGRCLPYIRTIYLTEPTYHEIPFLLLREINKVEDWLVTNKVTGFDPAVYPGNSRWEKNYNKAVNYHADVIYAGKLGELIDLMIREKKNSDTSLLHLFAAHLSTLKGDYKVARQHLAAAKTTKRLPLNVQMQIRINDFLLDLQTKEGFDFSCERNLMTIMQTPSGKSGIYDNDIMKDQLILFTARKLIEKGVRAKGYLLLGRTRRALGELEYIGSYKGVYQELEESATPHDYDRMIRIIDKKNKTPFETFIAKERLSSPAEYYSYNDNSETTKWSRNKLLDCKATRYIRNGDLKAAHDVLQQIPDDFWEQKPYATYIEGDPFFLNVYNAHRVTTEDKQNYTKKQIIARLIRLQQVSMQAGPKAAEADFLQANAWYNMGYHGKDWMIMKQWWSVSELSTYNSTLERSSFNDIYFGCTRARELYLKAMKRTKDKKLAVLCCFMAGWCYDTYQEYLWSLKNKGKSEAKDYKSVPNPYRAELKQKNIDDKYYEEIVQECAVYNDYIKRYNQ